MAAIVSAFFDAWSTSGVLTHVHCPHNSHSDSLYSTLALSSFDPAHAGCLHVLLTGLVRRKLHLGGGSGEQDGPRVTLMHHSPWHGWPYVRASQGCGARPLGRRTTILASKTALSASCVRDCAARGRPLGL